MRSLFRGRALRKLCFFLCAVLIISLSVPRTVRAAVPWPNEIAIQAEGGILMDADSGCVIYGKNLHERFFPASITKILTALIIV